MKHSAWLRVRRRASEISPDLALDGKSIVRMTQSSKHRIERIAMKRLLALWLVFAIACATCLAGPPAATGPMNGPLRVHPRNPRYFTDGSGKAIYLGGHQVFTDIQDNAWTKPRVLDWPRHLEFMKERPRPETAKVERTGRFQASGGVEEFKAPFVGPAVLYLKVDKERNSDNKGR